MSGITPTERRLYELCRKSFLSYWSFANPYRRDVTGPKELCDVLVVCDRHVIIFSDKSIVFPKGDIKLAWQRWMKRSIVASVRQLHGAHRMLQFPDPQICTDSSIKSRIRCDLPPVVARDVHLIAVANGATEACRQAFSEPIGTLMLTNDRGSSPPFMVGDVGHPGPFIHTLTDLSLELVLRELDTITDFVRYLRNRAAFFRGRTRFMVPGEEALLPLYFRGYSEASKDYDILRALPITDETFDSIAIDQGFWDDFVSRPEYRARVEQNRVSYLWDRLIEKFAKHQMDGTGTSYRPVGFGRHEGGMRYMALEPRVVRRGLSEQIQDAIEKFPDSAHIGSRTILPSDVRPASPAYLFMQLSPPADRSYSNYRDVRIELLRIYSVALLHDRPEIDRVVGIATEPPRLFPNRPISEDLLLVERAKLTLEDVASAKKQKAKLAVNSKITSGAWTAQEFPNIDSTRGSAPNA